MSKLVLILAVLGIAIAAPKDVRAQINPDALRAHWITTLSEYVTWPDEENISSFVIGVYGYNAPEVDELNKLKEQKTIKGKKFEVVHFKRGKDITFTNILYVNGGYNDDLQMINDKLAGQNTLIITNGVIKGSSQQNLFMLNLLLKGRGQQFEVNSSKAELAGIKISDKVLAQGGTKVDLMILNEGKDKELQEKENELKVLEQKLSAKRDEIFSLSVANDIQHEQNLLKKYELETKEKEIEEQKLFANKLLSDAERLKAVLFQNNIVLQRQEREINEKQEQLTYSTNELVQKQNRIAERERQIDIHEKRLADQASQISNQNKIINYALGFAAFIMSLVIISILLNRSRKRKNQILIKYNNDIERNKDQILAQSEQLQQINKELEKLSIVAAQTDNGVVIMDNNGNVEWVNRGFTNMYGFSAGDLESSKRNSLTQFYSSNKEINNIKEECLKSFSPKVYETEIQTKDGKFVWVQSTLTPILNENNEISRLVTIDTDITQIKEQENAILAQGMTLAAQRDELAEQKEYIEEQNQHISTSLVYAKTIQETVMPLEVNISKFFKYFGVFIPLQIVSGDYYWFTKIPDNPNITYIAAVDCTGHGVPGAFMCMISTRLLSEIIVEHKIYDTKEILNSLNTGLVAALKQDTTDNNDSLEICICKVVNNLDGTYEITYSGAKRPLYILHEDTHEFETLKADRKSIGGIMSKRNNLEFTSVSLTLKKGDKMYLTTDGFINQLDINNKKYGSDRFVNLIKSTAEKDLSEQKAIFEDAYYKFKGDAEQNDDITIFGVQLI
ncbi:MAG: DUF4154 domain-containing protein [Bacteroidales bacterium]|nr:DUF4154 domain-containing protein [Bacteroidales bacterium]